MTERAPDNTADKPKRFMPTKVTRPKPKMNRKQRRTNLSGKKIPRWGPR